MRDVKLCEGVFEDPVHRQGTVAFGSGVGSPFGKFPASACLVNFIPAEEWTTFTKELNGYKLSAPTAVLLKYNEKWGGASLVSDDGNGGDEEVVQQTEPTALEIALEKCCDKFCEATYGNCLKCFNVCTCGLLKKSMQAPTFSDLCLERGHVLEYHTQFVAVTGASGYAEGWRFLVIGNYYTEAEKAKRRAEMGESAPTPVTMGEGREIG